MEQSSVMSLVEVTVNTLLGFAVSVYANFLVLPLFGVPVKFSASVGITVIFTAISMVRSYFVRRFFAAHLKRIAAWCQGDLRRLPEPELAVVTEWVTDERHGALEISASGPGRHRGPSSEWLQGWIGTALAKRACLTALRSQRAIERISPIRHTRALTSLASGEVN
jgi:hypothetical protein